MRDILSAITPPRKDPIAHPIANKARGGHHIVIVKKPAISKTQGAPVTGNHAVGTLDRPNRNNAWGARMREKGFHGAFSSANAANDAKRILANRQSTAHSKERKMSFSDAVEDVKRYERSYRKLPPAHKKLEGQFILGSTTIATLFQTMTNFGPFHFQIFTLPVPALLKGFLCVVGTSLKYTVIQTRKIIYTSRACLYYHTGFFFYTFSGMCIVGAWDAVVTCFFLDTAHNIVEYIEIISRILKDEMSIELSLEDVMRVAFDFGFHLEHEKIVETMYTANPQAMMQVSLFTEFIFPKHFFKLSNHEYLKAKGPCAILFYVLQNRYNAAFWTMTKKGMQEVVSSGGEIVWGNLQMSGRLLIFREMDRENVMIPYLILEKDEIDSLNLAAEKISGHAKHQTRLP
ncbi:hypothetical protein IFM89_000103 [Coptis chinensis]|uniref:Uncharacterized protein n=1 Tax=Coptis chinensis TaxID=261450 RepID=A0A835HXZ6_9MAGN|nr:hypothetical protein IFM89_000103 [Coptis chinensis]